MLRLVAYVSVGASIVSASTIGLTLAGIQLSVFRASILLLLFIVFTNSLYRRAVPSRGGEGGVSLPWTLPHSVMLFWLAWSIFSVAWSADLGPWLRATFFVAVGAATALLFRVAFTSQEDLICAFRIMAVGSLLHNIVGWYEVSTGNLLFLDEGVDVYIEREFAASTFSNTNDFATYLLVSLSVLMIAARSFDAWWAKAAMYATVFSSVLLIVNSESRANLLAVAVWVIAVFVMRIRRVGYVIAAASAVSGIVILAQTGRLSILARSLGVDGLLSFNFDESLNSEGVRVNLARNGVQFLYETYGLGTGPGNVEYWVANNAQYPTRGIYNLHNWWLEIAASFGVIVFLAYLAMFAFLLIKSARSARRSGEPALRDYSAYLFASLAAFSVGSFSSSSNLTAEWLWVFFAVLISFVAYLERGGDVGRGTTSPDTRLMTGRRDGLL